MLVLSGAGDFTSPGSEPNHYVEQLRVTDLSVGTYSIPAGGVDDQSPHAEDEVYVPAGEKHRFVDVTADLALLVLFAPPYQSRL